MTLQELLGDGYKDGMTIEDIQKAISDKKFVDKNIFDTTAKELSGLKKKLKDTETDKLTAEQQLQKHLDEAEGLKNDYLKRSARLEVEREFAKAGINEDDYGQFIDGIVSADSEASLNLAKALVGTITKARDDSAQKTKQDILKDTPRPPAGGADAESDPFISGFKGTE